MPTTKNNQSVASQSTTPATAPVATPPAATPLAASPPDPNAALAQYVQQTVTALDSIEVGLGNDPALTPMQKRHAAKLRKGGAGILAQIGNLAQQEQIESAAVSVADMTAALQKADALQPLANRVLAFAKHVTDVIFTAQSDALLLGLQFYAMLQRRAVGDTELTAAMQQVSAFFAYRHPSTKVKGALTKPQQKATAKAVKTLKKNAPEMLQGPAPQGSAGAAGTGASGAPATGSTAAPAAGNGGVAVSGSGNGAAGPATPTGGSHS